MKDDFKKYVRNCKACLVNKTTRHTKEETVVTTRPTKSFDIISIDTVGPLTKTNKNNRYAITIQCDLTKYIVVIPIHNKEANTIARALVENIILIFGTFIELKSDQGLEYNNEILHNISEILKIKQTFSTAYHLQTIGSLERNHRCLNEYLRCYTNEHHDDWDDWTKFYEFVYNTTEHTYTNYTPYELVFGRKAHLPQDIYKTKIEPVYYIDDYYFEMKYKLQNKRNRQRKFDKSKA